MTRGSGGAGPRQFGAFHPPSLRAAKFGRTGSPCSGDSAQHALRAGDNGGCVSVALVLVHPCRICGARVGVTHMAFPGKSRDVACRPSPRCPGAQDDVRTFLPAPPDRLETKNFSAHVVKKVRWGWTIISRSRTSHYRAGNFFRQAFRPDFQRCRLPKGDARSLEIHSTHVLAALAQW